MEKPTNSSPVDDPSVPVPGEEPEKALLRSVTAGKGKPMNKWEMTALLETNGLRDVDARTDWGETDLFALPRRLFKYINELTYESRALHMKRDTLWVRVIKNYFKGALFALPMLLQIVSMIIVGFGIWSYLNFSIRDATPISLGTLLALAVTGGITQTLARKGLYYIKLDEMLLAAKVTRRLYALGIVVILLWGIVSTIINFYFKLYPMYMFRWYLMYYLLLSLVFLVFAIFYMLEAFGTISLMVLLGLITVYLAFVVFKVNIFYAHALSMLTIILAGNIIAYYILRRMERKSFSEGVILPKPSSLFYSLHDYFIFGTLYFLFLICDRTLAWTTGRTHLPYIFWFNYPYEVGVDWALFPLIFTLSLVEVFMHELGFLAFDKITEVRAHDVRSFNNYFIRLYQIGVLSFFIVGSIAIVISYYIPFAMSAMGGVFKFIGVFFNLVHVMVYLFASIAYVLLSWSLLNCIMFFSYSRPEFAIRSAGIALLVNFIVGYVFSRIFDYYYSVVGLLAGSVVFAILSSYWAIKFFRRYDYYYYSAY